MYPWLPRCRTTSESHPIADSVNGTFSPSREDVLVAKATSSRSATLRPSRYAADVFL